MQAPTQVSHRVSRSQTAVVLLHGLSGNTTKSWGRFVDYLLVDPAIQSWDLHEIGYPSSLRVDIPRVWSADPSLDILAMSLRTALSLPPLRNYRCLALIAHSMGGLVLQRAILDDKALCRRVSHAILFGSPSGGLTKASLFSGLKRQFRDMAAGGRFITTLRKDWALQFSQTPPFVFKAIAGDTDEFVPPSSSLVPFSDVFRAVVPGNHLSIVRPAAESHRGLRLVIDLLQGSGKVPGAVDGARLAVELGRFREAVKTLWPRAAELDEEALANLALALEGLDRTQDALAVLEEHGRGGQGLSTTDALGVLGGRIKRRWLVERAAVDLARARELYTLALEKAELAANHDQAYYHAINVAFLDLMASPSGQPVPVAARDAAQQALTHCGNASPGNWRVATEAEAHLILGDLSKAESFYKKAIAMTESPRAVQSMYSQAVRVAIRIYGDDGAFQIERLFGLDATGDSIEKPNIGNSQ